MLDYSHSPAARNSYAGRKASISPDAPLAPNPGYVFSAGGWCVHGYCLPDARHYCCVMRRIQRFLNLETERIQLFGTAGHTDADVDEHFASDDDKAQTSLRKKW